jgi:hypothetical protein
MLASRAWHGGLAVIAALNVLLQVVLTAQAGGGTPVTRLIDLFSFFTVLSNLLVIVSAAWLARRPDVDGRLWRVLRLDALACITLTGLVYGLLLRPGVRNEGWAVLTDAIFHYVVPVGAVLGWLAFGPRPRIDRRAVAASMVVPATWVAYTLLRGAATGRYPYDFMDVGALGYRAVLINVAAAAGSLLVLIGLVALGDRLPGTRPADATAGVEVPTK